MTNQSSPKNTRPSGARVENKRRTPRRKGGAKQSLIGVFVLAVGLAAFVAVLYLGYVRVYNAPEQAGGEQAEQSAAGTPAIEQSNTAGSQEERSQLRLNKASLPQMQGSWRTKYGAVTATLTLDDAEAFDLVLYLDAVGYERLVTKGTYTYDEENGIMRLKPSYDRPPKVEGANIAPLTYRPYNIIVLRKAGNGNILWVPHVKEGHRDQVHPIFVKLAVKDEYIEWSRQR